MPKRSMKPNRCAPAGFAEAAPIGTSVRFYPVLPCDEDSFEDSFVRSEPWIMGGRTVVKIEGRSGGVDVSHLVIKNPLKHVRGVLGFIRTK